VGKAPVDLQQRHDRFVDLVHQHPPAKFVERFFDPTRATDQALTAARSSLLYVTSVKPWHNVMRNITVTNELLAGDHQRS
jgi:hypothetical protein